MKSIIFLCSFAAMTSIASTECNTPQIARAVIRAIALVSHREMITDLVGGAIDSGEQSTYSIWANYRYHSYSDKYEVIVEEGSCQLISLRLVERNQPIKNGDAFWDEEIKEISLKTSINAETLFTHCDGRIRCEEVYKAVLKLPDLSLYTTNQHVNAFYIAGESSEISHTELISQLINESNNAGGQLNVKYTIKRENKYREGMRGGVYAPRPICLKVRIETINAQFQNGLTLQSKEREDLNEVSMNFCQEQQ